MLRVLLLICALSFVSVGQAQSMPGPWPFPWARECPVKWEALEGRYVWPESDQSTMLDLKVTIVDKLNFKVVRVTRYDRYGNLEAEGFGWVAAQQKTVSLWLNAVKGDERPSRAVLKLYYTSVERTCADDHLVAIMTLEQPATVNRRQTQYRLIKMDERRR